MCCTWTRWAKNGTKRGRLPRVASPPPLCLVFGSRPIGSGRRNCRMKATVSRPSVKPRYPDESLPELLTRLERTKLPYELRLIGVSDELFDELVDEDTKAELIDGVMVMP